MKFLFFIDKFIFFVYIIYIEGIDLLMKYLFKIMITIFILLLAFITSTQATQDSLNSSFNNYYQNLSYDEGEFLNNTYQKVSVSGDTEYFTLSVSNIIDIIVIAVGIVLIFLAIAILIKLK